MMLRQMMLREAADSPTSPTLKKMLREAAGSPTSPTLSSVVPEGEMDRLHALHEARARATSETARIMGEKCEQRFDQRREYLTRRQQHLRKLYVTRQQRDDRWKGKLQESPFAASVVNLPDVQTGASGPSSSRSKAKGSGTRSLPPPDRLRSATEGPSVFRGVAAGGDEPGVAAARLATLNTIPDNRNAKAQQLLQEQRRIAIERRQKQLQDMLRPRAS